MTAIILAACCLVAVAIVALGGAIARAALALKEKE